MSSDTPPLLSEKRRKEILEDIARGRCTGAKIPKDFPFEGKRTGLRPVVSNMLMRKEEGDISDSDRKRAEELAGQIRTRIRELVERLTSSEISRAEGEEIDRECSGLNKALDILESLGRKRHSRKLQKTRVEDARRWMEFGRNISGRR